MTARRRSIVATAVLALAATLLIVLALAPDRGSGHTAAPPAPVEDAGGTEHGRPMPPEPPSRVATLERPDEAELAAPQPIESAERNARVTAKEPWSASLRGRVLHQLTGEPIPGIRVEVRGGAPVTEVTTLTDEEGRFETLPYEAQTLRLGLFDDFANKRLHVRSWSHRAERGAMEWRVPIGPTYRFRVVGGPAKAKWKARVVETDDHGEERRWRALSPLPHPDGRNLWIRYRRIEKQPDPAWRPSLRVVDETGMWAGEMPLQTTVSFHPAAFDVVVHPAFASLEGRVVDSEGAPLEGRVLLLRGEDSRKYRRWRRADVEDGSYHFDRLPAGEHRVTLSADYRGTSSAVVRATLGATTVHDFVLRPLVPGGEIEGAIVGPPDGGGPVALVRLESVGGGHTPLEHRIHRGGSEEERVEFVFTDVPAGNYRVSLIPLDGRAYAPSSIDVSPPRQGIVFRTHDRKPAARVEYLITVRDAESREPLEKASFAYRLEALWVATVERTGGQKIEESPRGFTRSFVASAPGYRPAVTSLADARPDGDAMRLDIDLERGHGAALVIYDMERLIGGSAVDLDFTPALGLAGARVVVAGRTVGVSDATGLALVATDAPIERYDVLAPGYVVVERRRFRNHAETPDGIGFVLMARE